MPELESRYEDIKEGEFWKDTLYEILSTMDPWNVDIVKLAKEYSAKIENLKDLNFKIPANALIVCAVLLRMKADLLMAEENKEEDYADMNTDEDTSYDSEHESRDKLNLGDLSLIPKRVLKRKISADELMNAINEVLKTEKSEVNERKDKKKTIERQTIEITPSADIRKSIDEIYKEIINFLNNNENINKNGKNNDENFVKFSQISDKEKFVRNFISLLFLSDEGKILLKQDELYGEIFILRGKNT
ncbi:putative chromosome segregation and condensation protein ScpA [groundwater metagenome]|uniref:Putative chromosome segregation and condensation protein ScpA n=1 Tax=groundwater metagenome TaxID=717931 RepID=A0A098E8B1_9ZZZZ